MRNKVLITLGIFFAVLLVAAILQEVWPGWHAQSVVIVLTLGLASFAVA